MSEGDTASVTVTFAGSGDAFGSGGRLQACIHLSADANTGVLLDCGATSLIALARQGIDPNTIATVFVSHMHVDHFGGIPQLILDGQFRRRTAPLTVAGPQGLAARLTDAMEVMFPGSSTVRRRFGVYVIELDPADPPRVIGSVTVQAWPVDHGIVGGPFLALRVGHRRQNHRLHRRHGLDGHADRRRRWNRPPDSRSILLGQTGALPSSARRPGRAPHANHQCPNDSHVYVDRHAGPRRRCRIRTRTRRPHDQSLKMPGRSSSAHR